MVTRQAAHFTDTTRPFLYHVAVERDGQPGSADVIPLPAKFGVRGGCTIGSAPRANGIAATEKGKHLIVIHMSEGQLYLPDTDTLTPIPIDITGGDFTRGGAVCDADGLLLDGRTLYVAQPSLSRVAVVGLSPDHLSGFATRYITEPFASNPALRRDFERRSTSSKSLELIAEDWEVYHNF